MMHGVYGRSQEYMADFYWDWLGAVNRIGVSVVVIRLACFTCYAALHSTSLSPLFTRVFLLASRIVKYLRPCIICIRTWS